MHLRPMPRHAFRLWDPRPIWCNANPSFKAAPEILCACATPVVLPSPSWLIIQYIPTYLGT
jgi:hypothetical protein